MNTYRCSTPSKSSSLSVEKSNSVDGGAFVKTYGGFFHLSREDTLSLIHDLQEVTGTLSAPPSDYVGGFNEGDLVKGPFVVIPSDERGLMGAYAPGLGIVDPSVDQGGGYVPVRVLKGDRMSGGYLPDALSVIELDL